MSDNVVHNRSYGELLLELRETRRQLRLARGELGRANLRLGEALAQANHDRELINSMQTRLTHLQHNSARVMESHAGSPPSSGPSADGSQSSPTESITRFPDLEYQTEPYHAPQPVYVCQNANGSNADATQLTTPSSGGPTSSNAGLSSPFFSMVLGPYSHQPINMGEHTYTYSDFDTKVAALWEASEKHAKALTNSPDAIGDQHTPARALDRYVWGAPKEAITPLLNDGSTRFLVVAKVINSFIVSEILKVDIFRGFDSTADSEIERLLNNFYLNTPLASRRRMFNAVAKQVGRLRSTPLFQNHLNKRMHECTNALLDLLSPLIRHREHAAFTRMADLMKGAHHLALQMFSGPYEFRFTQLSFCVPFDPSVMVDRDIVKNQAKVPNMLDAGRFRFRVRLAVTPIMYFRNVNSAPALPMKMACASQVILTEVRDNNHSNAFTGPMAPAAPATLAGPTSF